MSLVIERYNKIITNISDIKPPKPINIIAISKTFQIDHIRPLVDFGHNHFGENKVQEAITKWTEIRKLKKNLQLHMVGKLQSNKAKDAVKIFDISTL